MLNPILENVEHLQLGCVVVNVLIVCVGDFTQQIRRTDQIRIGQHEIVRKLGIRAGTREQRCQQLLERTSNDGASFQDEVVTHLEVAHRSHAFFLQCLVLGCLCTGTCSRGLDQNTTFAKLMSQTAILQTQIHNHLLERFGVTRNITTTQFCTGHHTSLLIVLEFLLEPVRVVAHVRYTLPKLLIARGNLQLLRLQRSNLLRHRLLLIILKWVFDHPLTVDIVSTHSQEGR
mmetsp:Transcript_5881/g.18007  ORF Transcript_5881/g.18007 Transcript_5881/m.18007 type:complete len:231 (-) Transcript_5881:208-900(-)